MQIYGPYTAYDPRLVLAEELSVLVDGLAANPFVRFSRSDADGEDYYDWVQARQMDDPELLNRYAMLDVSGCVVALDEDPSRFDPREGLRMVLLLPGEEADYGWLLSGDGTALEPPIVVVGPPPTPDISDRQFFQGLYYRSHVSLEEALAAVTVGTIPPSFMALIDTLQEPQRTAAIFMVSGATTFERHHELTPVFAQLYGWSEAQTDEFFFFASTL